MNVIDSKKLVLAAALALGTFTATGCTAEEQEEVANDTQALDSRTGGSSFGYTCTDSGFCQCKGLADCNDMFGVCKSLTYCNMDAQGLRCSCLDHVLSRTGTTKGSVSTGDSLVAK